MSKKKGSLSNANRLLWLLVVLLICLSVLLYFMGKNGYLSQNTYLHAPNNMLAQPMSAAYQTQKSNGAVVLLQLSSDGKAKFSPDILKSNSNQNKTGKWSGNTKGEILVNFSDSSQLNFILENQKGINSLSLLNPETKVWGKDGLVLQNINPLIDQSWVLENNDKNKYSLRFTINNKLSVTTECNSLLFKYTVSGKNGLSISSNNSKTKSCSNNSESQFLKSLPKVNEYYYQDGLLYLVSKNQDKLVFKKSL